MTAADESLSADRAQHIATVLESVVRLSRSLARPHSTPFADVMLTRTQLEVLFVLAHAERSVAPGQLAALLKVTPGAITQAVERLHEQGLVEQSVSGRDGRVRVLELTEAARTHVEQFEVAAVQRAAPWFEELSDDTLEQLASSIRQVREN